jgi:hypothetical protein
LAIVGLAYLLPLLAHGAIGSFARYWADDFCAAAWVRTLGPIQAGVVTYLSGSGRYSYLVLINLASLLGPGLAPILPAGLIILWLAALSWALVPLFPHVWPQPLAAVVMATIAVSTTLSAIPNVAQSLYWRNSSLTYTAPLVVGSLLAGIVLRQSLTRSHPLNWLLVFALAIIAGGFSEIYTALQLALFGLGLLVIFAATRQARQWHVYGPFLAGLLGSLCAMAAIALSPGTRARQALLAPSPGLWSLIDNSLLYSRWFVRDAFLGQLPSLLAALTASACLSTLVAPSPLTLARGSRRKWAAVLLALPLVTFGLIVVCYGPAFYALLYLPPDRVLIINWFVLIGGTAAGGFLAGLLAAPAVQTIKRMVPRLAIAASVMMAALLSVPPVVAAARTASDIGSAKSYASTWDSYDQLLTRARANQVNTVTLAQLTTPGHIDNLNSNPSFFTNECVAQYYGVRVTAIVPPPVPTQADLAQFTPLHANIGGVADVLGYRLDQAGVRGGQVLTVTVYWLPRANTDRPYTVFIHLYNLKTGSLGQFDGYPGQGKYLTTLWIHGQPFADTYRLPIRPLAEATNASFILGLYDLPSSKRLPVTGADAGPPGVNWVQFGQVQVMPYSAADP